MHPKIKVISTGKYIPQKTITNEDLSKIVDTNDEWIVSRTGIKNRHQVTDELTSDMAYLAAEAAIGKANYDRNQIDLVIVASITGDQKTPSTANFVQGKLGLNHSVMSFDVNAACTGFIYALEIASSLLLTNRYRSALVIGAETLTEVTDYTDRNTCILFGDGAGAIIIEPSQDEADTTYFYNDAKADLKSVLTVKKHIKMEGQKVYLFAIDVMQKAILNVLEQANLTIDDIDIIIPHQANIRIIQTVAKNMNIPIEKFMINLNQYGNTSAASVPITLDEYLDREKKPKKALLVGFGGGFTWGAALINL